MLIQRKIEIEEDHALMYVMQYIKLSYLFLQVFLAPQVTVPNVVYLQYYLYI